MEYYHYFFEPSQDAYIIELYDTKKSGEIQHAHGFPENETVFIYNRRLLTNRNQLTKTLRDAVNGANGDGRFKTPVLYNGININTIIEDIFICMTPAGDFYRPLKFDDTLLNKFERVLN